MCTAYFREGGVDPAVGDAADEEAEAGPAVTRAAGADAPVGLVEGAGAVVLKVADCRLADIDGRRCYLSLDKRCKRKDQWDVGLCSKSREENAGQKPRAVYGRRKMTTREVKCALVSE